MIRDILDNLAVGGKKDVAARYAISVARLMDAHLTGVAFAHEPVVPGTIFDGVSASIVASYRAETGAAAKAATENFEKAARGAAVETESRVFSSTVEGAAEAFGRLARRYDLSIVGQAEPDAPLDGLIIEAALFDSGRPVLVVPYIQTEGIKLDRVLLCWDGSRNAARAFGDAMPLLERSGNIELITIANKDDNRDEISGADMAHHLARHRLRVELKRIVSVDGDVGATILSHAADMSADLIVMGGYGHSRLREFVLGGATRTMLSSMTVPTLMSH
jgi:nucleotide-binding universal stress UspA family protein